MQMMEHHIPGESGNHSDISQKFRMIRRHVRRDPAFGHGDLHRRDSQDSMDIGVDIAFQFLQYLEAAFQGVAAFFRVSSVAGLAVYGQREP